MMSNYIPNYGKIRESLRKAQALLRLIHRGGSHKAILKAAEEMKAARIIVLKSMRAQIVLDSAKCAEVDEQIRQLLEIPVEKIVEELRGRRG